MKKKFAAAFVALFVVLSSADAREVSRDVEVIWSGPEERPRIALTFDDGPRSDVTDRILDQLSASGARATFFVLGRRIQYEGAAGAALLRRIVDEGHELGNHSYSHPMITRLSRSALEKEISRTQNLIEKHAGVRPKYFRPPGGAISVSKIRELASTEMEAIVMWSIDPADWSDKSNFQIWKHIADRAENGSIILLHDIHRDTVKALPLLIDLLQARGYELVTVSELLERP